MNYTGIEQSKKLVELGLSIETSDMSYIETPANEFRIMAYSYKEVVVLRDARGSDATIYPAWSLGALLELMPKNIKKGDEKLPFHLFQFKDTWGVQYGYPNETEYAVLIENKTPLEAAYNMVVWLLENNYIKKEKI